MLYENATIILPEYWGDDIWKDKFNRYNNNMDIESKKFGVKLGDYVIKGESDFLSKDGLEILIDEIKNDLEPSLELLKDFNNLSKEGAIQNTIYFEKRSENDFAVADYSKTKAFEKFIDLKKNIINPKLLDQRIRELVDFATNFHEATTYIGSHVTGSSLTEALQRAYNTYTWDPEELEYILI